MAVGTALPTNAPYKRLYLLDSLLVGEALRGQYETNRLHDGAARLDPVDLGSRNFMRWSVERLAPELRVLASPQFDSHYGTRSHVVEAQVPKRMVRRHSSPVSEVRLERYRHIHGWRFRF